MPCRTPPSNNSLFKYRPTLPQSFFSAFPLGCSEAAEHKDGSVGPENLTAQKDFLPQTVGSGI
jgi:hypothetical protein